MACVEEIDLVGISDRTTLRATVRPPPRSHHDHLFARVGEHFWQAFKSTPAVGERD